MKTIEKKYLIPFCLVTLLFLLWGIANNMTDTLLSAFKRIMSMTDTQTSFIQFAFYGSYFCFALPAALFIRKYSYKSGVILGLILYAAGAILFFPASQVASYIFYLIAIYILAGGCSILETTANPYILAMGDPKTATRRLNIAQAFNPLGSITGILLSQFFILSELNSATATEREAMTETQLAEIQSHELSAVTGTYMTLGFVLLAIMVIMLLVKMPKGGDDSKDSVKESFSRLFKNKKYIFGVVAQFFYVGAQIGVWSYTIRLVMQELGINEANSATYYLISIICFSSARFLFTWLMKWLRPSKLLLWASVADIIFSGLVIIFSGTGTTCIIALISISFFMSLMFPTIYGIALEDVGSDAKIGASGLIMAILGGALITPLQGLVSDASSINISYIVPLICFVVVLLFSIYVEKHTTKEVKEIE
ncbi:MAG: L-fucose:H+ symporter permease [Bacteroidales bacterium]|nr:L-fucose:H+ symporter permease [Bacteroidales bacterium]